MPRSSENTRINILDATISLLESGRTQEVRISDIARQAGVSRQGLYLHFRTRAELLISATRYLDEVNGIDERLATSRSAASGLERLDAWIVAWGSYIPEIYGLAKALLAMKDEDVEAAAAWDDRMQAVRHGCQAAVKALHADGVLNPDYTPRRATDLLFTMLSVRNWESFTIECGWSQKAYLKELKYMARATLVTVDER